MPALVDELTAIARASASTDGASRVLSDRADGLVLRLGDVVVKAHPAGMDEERLSTRVRFAAEPALRPVMLSPLSGPTRLRDRLVTVWPAGTPVDPSDPDAAPWEAAAGLLAGLHAVPPPGPGFPEAGGPARVARALSRLAGVSGAAADTVRRAHRALPGWARGGSAAGAAPPGRAPGLTHGDWHLGQLVRTDAWHLIDVDDLGLGEPAWDLARPAALYAVGFLAPGTWRRFLSAYLAAGGSAVGRGDEWERLDVPARALVVQTAALAVVAADREERSLAEADRALVDACARMAPRTGVFVDALP